MTFSARRSPRSRPRAARIAAALLLLLAVTLAIVAGPPGGASMSSAATAGNSSDQPITIQLTTMEPKAPQPHDTLVVEGRLVNTGTETVGNLHVRLDVGGYIDNRSYLGSWLDANNDYIGPPRNDSQLALDPDTLAPDDSAPFRVSVKVDDLHLRVPGVYAFGVEARGHTETNGYGTVGRLRIPLPWAPAGSIQNKARLAWVWPLVDRPHRDVSTVFRDDTLADKLTGDGRLRRLLDDAASAATPARIQPGTAPPAAPVPVTWALDPLLLQDAALMADGYQVAGTASAPKTAGAGAQAAQAWLQRLRDAVRGGDVITLPYADVDISALVRAGLDRDVEHALFSGTQVAGDILGVPVRSAVAWPTGGYLTDAALRTLIQANVGSLVLRSDALPLESDLTYTPSAHTQLSVPGGTVEVVVTDAALDDTVMKGVVHPSAGRWAEQRFLAETLLFAEELPSRQRDLVVAPDRRWLPPVHYAAALLDDTARMPWLEPVTVADVQATPASEAPRGDLTYPQVQRSDELPASYLSDVAPVQSEINDLESIFADPRSTLARELYLGGLRMESSAWRNDLAQARRVLGDVADRVTEAHRKVAVVSSGLVTLTSSSGTVPITVANRLDQPVRVRLAVNAGGRAKVTDSGTVHELAAGTLTQLEVHMSAQTNGVFLVRAQLLTPTSTPQPYGPVQTLRVRSTAYGTVALGITGGAFGVLLIAVAVRLTRRALAAHRGRRGDSASGAAEGRTST